MKEETQSTSTTKTRHHRRRRRRLGRSSFTTTTTKAKQISCLLTAILLITTLVYLHHRYATLPSTMNRTTRHSKWSPAARNHHGSFVSNLKVNLEDVKENDPEAARRMEQKVLDGTYHLVDVYVPRGALHVRSGEMEYEGVRGLFCHLEWEKHKEDPTRVPMFHDLIRQSPSCQRKLDADLTTILHLTKTHDQSTTTSTNSTIHSLPIGGFIHHASRCGSTLLSNALVASNPTHHRVYSEHPALPRIILACHDDVTSMATRHASCNIPLTTKLLQDVVYLMGRSNQIQEQVQFYKFPSSSTRGIALLRQAFPEVPWMFLYRDFVQIMQSYFKGKLKRGGGSMAKCASFRRRPTRDYRRVVEERLGEKDGEKVVPMSSLSNEMHCAAYLATICTAVQNEQRFSNHSGIMVNYNQLPQAIYTLFPTLFHIPLDLQAKNRIESVTKTYSKGRDQTREWVEDDEEKNEAATEEMREASGVFLEEVYGWLEEEMEGSLGKEEGKNGEERKEKEVRKDKKKDKEKEEKEDKKEEEKGKNVEKDKKEEKEDKKKGEKEDKKKEQKEDKEKEEKEIKKKEEKEDEKKDKKEEKEDKKEEEKEDKKTEEKKVKKTEEKKVTKKEEQNAKKEDKEKKDQKEDKGDKQSKKKEADKAKKEKQ